MNIAKKILTIASICAGLALCACSNLANRTPETMRESSSRVYPLTFDADIKDGSLVPGSLKAYVIIDAERLPMREVIDERGKTLFQYDYVMPANRNSAKYYFEATYDSKMNTGVIQRKIKSPQVYDIGAVGRYVVNAHTDRGVVGSEVTVLGNGFTPNDKVYLGTTPAETRVISRTSLSFTVPAVDADKKYDLEVVGAADSLWVCSFRVDISNMAVSPTAFMLEKGGMMNMIFDIGFKAPAGGFPIDVKTNIPSSVIMPEVVVPEGSSSVSVPVEAAAAGKGSIYVNAKGFKEKIIPVDIADASAGN